LGFPLAQKAYEVCILHNCKIFTSKHVTFQESIFPFAHPTTSMRTSIICPNHPEPIDDGAIHTHISSPVVSSSPVPAPPPPNFIRFSRHVRPPIWMKDYTTHSAEVHPIFAPSHFSYLTSEYVASLANVFP